MPVSSPSIALIGTVLGVTEFDLQAPWGFVGLLLSGPKALESRGYLWILPDGGQCQHLKPLGEYQEFTALEHGGYWAVATDSAFQSVGLLTSVGNLQSRIRGCEIPHLKEI